MALEDYVCTLESAKQLKELGIPQDKSIFIWVERWLFDPKTQLNYRKHVIEMAYSAFNGEFERRHELVAEQPVFCAAFIAQELMEKLPINLLVDHEGILISYRLRTERFILVGSLDPVNVMPCFKINYDCNDYCSTGDNRILAPISDSLFKKAIIGNNEAEALAKALIKLIEEKYLKIEEL